MNTYLLPICYPDVMPEIITIIARSYNEAEEKFIRKIVNKMDFDIDPDNLKELRSYACEYDCLIGDIYDKDQF